MEENKKKQESEGDKEIVFSKAIKAGKRIYYLDVKKSKKGEMFLAITESKKVVSGEGNAAQVNFEKHKIFLYKEDFEKFMNGLQESIQYIEKEQGALSHENHADKPDETTRQIQQNDETLHPDEFKIDIEF